MNNETYDGVKEKPKKKDTLKLLELVMFGNRNIGEVDQAYNELKQRIKTIEKLVKLYSYLNENTNDYDLNCDEVAEIEQLIQTLEKELGEMK